MQVTAAPLWEQPLGKVAFVMSNAIGDTLLCMIIVKNLIKNGIAVTVFGTPAFALRTWFPDVDMLPLPSYGDVPLTLAAFDTVIQQHTHQPVPMLSQFHRRVVTLHHVEYSERQGCMGERFADFCRRELSLPNIDLDNGLTVPAGLQHRRYMQRVVIHPEASTPDKCWTRQSYINLALKLRHRGFDVHFVIAPNERARWVGLNAHGISAPPFSDLNALAGWVYESGWFIGNDSGIGHLASNLGIPTLSLFRRRQVANRWRPVWGSVGIVLPWQWVPTSFLKEKFWRQTLTCGRVLRGFSRLQVTRTPVDHQHLSK